MVTAAVQMLGLGVRVDVAENKVMDINGKILIWSEHICKVVFKQVWDS